MESVQQRGGGGWAGWVQNKEDKEKTHGMKTYYGLDLELLDLFGSNSLHHNAQYHCRHLLKPCHHYLQPSRAERMGLAYVYNTAQEMKGAGTSETLCEGR